MGASSTMLSGGGRGGGYESLAAAACHSPLAAPLMASAAFEVPLMASADFDMPLLASADIQVLLRHHKRLVLKPTMGTNSGGLLCLSLDQV
jgi:hypothetical protein